MFFKGKKREYKCGKGYIQVFSCILCGFLPFQKRQLGHKVEKNPLSNWKKDKSLQINKGLQNGPSVHHICPLPENLVVEHTLQSKPLFQPECPADCMLLMATVPGAKLSNNYNNLAK